MIGFDLGNRCQCSKTFGRHCRSIPKLLDGKTTGLCQLSETCRHYRVFHNQSYICVIINVVQRAVRRINKKYKLM